MDLTLKRLGSSLLFLACALGSEREASAQAFVVDDSKIPFHYLPTQEVELGDVDLDGDWDAALGNASEASALQSTLWINQGGLQGAAEGFFVDDTAARFPQMQANTFDLCLGDIEGDGDLDLHVSNSINGLIPGNLWWINVGGEQGGTLGYFADETAARWIGLGQPGSSIPPSYVMDGTFFDDCRDSEFADLDNDGDLDLIHSAYSLSFDRPSRIFLNDGDGYFQEFNPSGFMTTGYLRAGEPGLWCDGVYDNLTVDATGAFCDPTTSTLDADVGDLDGDFDPDLVFAEEVFNLGFFANRLEESVLGPDIGGGALGFRDVAGAVLAPGFGGYEGNVQELGDVDGDGDLDLAGGDCVIMGPTTSDGLFEWVGGAFVLRTVLPNAGQKRSAELFDHDGDGDLDFLIVGDTVQLHSNQGGFAFTAVPMPSWTPSPTGDADVADLDGDGDLDILACTISGPGGMPEHLLVNQSDVPDAHAPTLPLVEGVADRTAASAPLPVRAYVYDNAPHYVTARNPTHVELAVDGVALPPIAALASRGQVFRAELPGNLAGQVAYRFVSEDESGNAGASAELAYASTAPAAFQAAYGAATTGLAGGAPLLRALSVPFAGTTLHLALSSGAPPGTQAILGVGTLPLTPGVHLPGLLLLQVAGQVLATFSAPLDAGGNAVFSAPLGAVPAGLTAYAQGFVLDPTAGGDVLASSEGLALTTQ